MHEFSPLDGPGPARARVAPLFRVVFFQRRTGPARRARARRPRTRMGSLRRTVLAQRARVAPPPLSRIACFRAGWAQPDARTAAPPALGLISAGLPQPHLRASPTLSRIVVFSHAGWAQPDARASAPPAHVFSAQNGPCPVDAHASPPPPFRALCFSTQDGVGPTRAGGPARSSVLSQGGPGPTRARRPSSRAL